MPRSHRYESKIDKPELSANLQPLRLAYDCLQILSDLGFLILGYGFTFELPRDLDRTVRDLVDQMLVGAVNKIVSVVGMNLENGLYWQRRDERDVPLSE